jgi:hypothetical protein
MGRCLNCREKFEPKYFLQKFCGSTSCTESEKKYKEEKLKERQKKPNLQLSKMKPMKKVSDKRALENIIYKSERIKFLQLPENRICPITNQPTTDVHHMKGRIGSLLLDKRFWKALSREGHKFVEENPIWAKENGYSLNRLTDD